MKKTFEIEYKIGYSEIEDYEVEKVKATNEKEALRIFSNRKKISKKDLKNFAQWMWHDGPWLAFFKKIKEAKISTGGN